MEPNNILQQFLQVHPMHVAEPVSDEIIDRYIDVVPDFLLKFWKELGLGVYGSGWIQFINPDDYREVVNQWLMREDDGARIPFAISAFGEVFYWRNILNTNAIEEIQESVFDVSYFNPHNTQTGLCAYSMEEFFGEYCTDPQVISAFKWYADDSTESLFDQAIAKLGILEKDQMYCFFPALVLGGYDDVDHLEKGNAVVHLDILLQMTGSGSYGDDNFMFDYVEENIKLKGDPIEYDRKIEELKSELESDISDEDAAYKYYLIGKLLDLYPYYHPSIQNAEQVRKHTKHLAKINHENAKKLDPDNPKYFYASFNSVISDYNGANLDGASLDLERYFQLSGDEDIYYRGKYDIAYYNNDHEGVLEYAERLFEYSGNFSYLNGAASYFQNKGHHQQALKIYNRIFSESYEYYDAKTAAIGIADVRRDIKLKKEAIQIFDELKAKFPEFEADILNETGLFLQRDYNDRQRDDNAIEYFQKAVKKAEDNLDDNDDIANYYYNLYDAYNQKQEFQNARIAIEKAAELTDNTLYADELARLLYKMGLEEEAQESFSNSECRDSSFSKRFISNNWEEIIWKLDNSFAAFDRKIENIEAELKEEPSNSDKHFLLGKLCESYPLFMMDESDREKQEILMAKRGYESLLKATQLDPTNPVYQLHLANFLYLHQSYLGFEDATSIDMMNSAYQFYIDHSEDPYEGYVGLKRMAVYYDDWEKRVIHYARLAYESRPEMTSELLELGNAYIDNNQYTLAAQVFQEYLMVEPSFYGQLEAKKGLSVTYIKSGEATRAEKLIEDIADNAENDEQRYEVYAKAAEAFVMNDDLKNAIKYAEKAVFFSERTGDLRYFYPTAILNLSMLYEQKGNLHEAITLAQKNCDIRGDFYDYSRMGYLYIENKKPNEARTALQKALEINPDDSYTNGLLDELENNKGGGLFRKLFR